MAEERDLTKELIAGQEPIDTLEESIEPDRALMMQFQKRMANGFDYFSDNMRKSAEDVEFIYGNQWDRESMHQRDIAGRPYLTMNVLPRHINQIVGLAQKSKFAIRVLRKAGDAGYGSIMKEKSKTPTSLPYNEIMEGLIRDIEIRSQATNEYCRALQDAVEGGFGWLRVRTHRTADDPFNIQLSIEHIRDRYSVLFDPFSTKDDLSDAMWMCLSEILPFDEYEMRYPNAPKDFQQWDGLVGNSHNEFNAWWGQGGVRICEYYYKEPAKRRYVQLINEQSRHEIVCDPEEIVDLMDELMDMGYIVNDETEVDSYIVKVLRCTSNTILESPQEWPGMNIPIVPVFGRKLWRNNHMDTISLIRNAKDPQRVLNYWITAATERVGNSPKEPWVVTVGMIAGHEEQWSDGAVERAKTLLYNDTLGSNKEPRRQAGATMPAAEMEIVRDMRMTIMDVIGLHEANLGEASNETSGVAIRNRQAAGDTGTYEYINSLAYSIRAVADILIEIIPKIYTNDRAQNIVLPDDSSASAYLRQELIDKQTGLKISFGNINLSRYSCTVKVGPAATTQRQITLELLTDIFQNSPQTLQKVEDLYFQLLDLPNEREYVDRIKRSMPPHLLKPEDRVTNDEEPLPPTPAEQAEMAKYESLTAVSQAKTEEATLNLQTAKIELEKTNVEAASKASIAKSAERKVKSEEMAGVNENAIQSMVNKIVKQEVAKGIASMKAKNK